MSNGAYRAARMRRELMAGTYGKPPVDLTTPFLDSDWKFAASFREARDRADTCPRWRVSVIPVDGVKRIFFLVGSLESVERRALALYPQSMQRVIRVEPEKLPGPEILSSRLSMSTTK